MKSITRLSLVLVMLFLFSISYLVTSVTAQGVAPGMSGQPEPGYLNNPGMPQPGIPPMGNQGQLTPGMPPMGYNSGSNPMGDHSNPNQHMNQGIKPDCAGTWFNGVCKPRGWRPSDEGGN
jgi:hypothetical protein